MSGAVVEVFSVAIYNPFQKGYKDLKIGGMECLLHKKRVKKR
jgi:hypothetical protein